jgi:hypothetical protein
MEIKDSGTRREFESGAVRDIAEGKGRCDLLPLGIIGNMTHHLVLVKIDDYIRVGDLYNLFEAISLFVESVYSNNVYTALLELSKHYEEGSKKYSDRNWEKGIPLHCFIDSGVRHYLKYMRGDEDEPHDRAFLWNMFGAIWTHKNHPELIDLPFKKEVNHGE